MKTTQETIKEQETTLSHRLSSEKNKMQKAWKTKLKSPTGWFRATQWHFSSETLEAFKNNWKRIDSKKKLHKNAYLLFQNLFYTLNYAFTGLAILLNDVIQTALIIAKNTAVFCKDVARVIFCGLGLLAEGITWSVTAPINFVINWAKKPSNPSEDAAQNLKKQEKPSADIHPEAPPAVVAKEDAPSPSIQASYSTEHGVNVNVNVSNIKIPESLESAGRKIFGSRPS